jgi:phage terminase small subunit
LLRNTEVAARISEILRRGAERAEITVEQVLRELAKIGFSDIRKAVAWRNEMVAREGEEEGKGEDGVVRVTRVLLPRVSIVPSEEMDPDIAAAIAQISQGPNGQVRVRLHDKHAALVSIGKHLGMFVDRVQIQERKQISAEPMSAEEWKRQYVREG